METPERPRLPDSLARARLELLPIAGAAEAAEQLPAGTTVTVTCSPAKGIEATLELASGLQRRGLHAVPHLAARLIADTAHLSDLLARVKEAGLDEVFVVAGDSPEPRGAFPDALALLQAIQCPDRPLRVGITGYPERHPHITDDAAIRAMTAKARFADYIVSQMCFDPRPISRWAAQVRARDVGLPIYVGIPGVIGTTKLLRVSVKIGLGGSLRFLRNQPGVVSELFGNYVPDGLVTGLAPDLSAGTIAGWHMFTFNEITKTLAWQRDFQQRLQQEASA